MPSRASAPELLLTHAEFVRRLARALLGGDGEDLAQQAWVRALEHPPERGDNLRAWWAVLVQRLASNVRRAEARAEARERAAAPRDHAPSPAEILEREDARRRVVAAVLELEEPLRETILLRFYEDRKPHAIARQLGVPAATVRTRLHRGLRRLRDRLDHEGERGRRAWAAPLAGWAAPAAPTGVLLIGVLAMQKIVVSVLVAGLLLVAGLWWWNTNVQPEPAAGPVEEPAAGVAAAGAQAQAEAARRVVATAAPRTAVEGAPAARTYPADRGSGGLHGVVHDVLGQTVAGATVQLRPFLGYLPPGMRLADDRTFELETTSDERGVFRFAAIVEGPCVATARHGETWGSAVGIVNGGREAGPIVIVLNDGTPRSGDDVRVQVLDAAGTPVAGAALQGFVFTSRDALRGSGDRPPLTGTSDAQGAWRIVGQRLVHGVFFARTADGRAGMQVMSRDDQRTLTIHVAATGSIRGRLTGAAAEALRGAHVLVHARSSLESYHTATGRATAAAVTDGGFAVADLPAGTYGITLESPAGLRLELDPLQFGGELLANSIAMLGVEVKPGATAEVVLRVRAAGRIDGRVLGTDERPVAGARVRAVFAPASSNYPAGFTLFGAHVWRLDGPHEAAGANPETQRETTTDAAGRYQLLGLQPGRHRVEVTAEGLGFDRRLDVLVHDGETIALHHTLAPAGVLQVATRDVTYLGVARRGDLPHPVALAIVGWDTATIPGLAAGEYTVGRYHSDASVAPVPLADVTIVAGRTTWVDVRDRATEFVVRGRLLASGRAVAGELVTLAGKMVPAEADGRFRIVLGYRPQLGLGDWGERIQVGVGASSYVFELAELLPGIRTATDLASCLETHELELRLGEHHLDVLGVDADGEPAPVQFTFRVEAGPRVAGWPSSSGGTTPQTATTTRLDRLMPGTCWLEARFADGSQAFQKVEVPARGPVTVRAPPIGTLAVTLVDGRGTPVRATVLYGYTWTGAGAPPSEVAAFRMTCESRQAATDAEGVARLAGIRAGEVLLVLARQPDVAVARVRVERGQVHALRLVVPR